MNKVKAEAGEMFINFIKRVQAALWYTRENNVICEFNEIEVVVNKHSLIEDICTIYDLKRRLSK